MTDDPLANLRRRIGRERRIATCESVATYYLGLESLRSHRHWWKDVDSRGAPLRYILPAPRDHGKSTAITLVLPLKRILNDPNHRVLIVQKRMEQAKKSLRLLREQFEKNSRIIEDFGDLTAEPWAENMFYVERDLSGSMAKDPTCEAVGVGGSITGGHFDTIILDDILDETNTKTQTLRDHISNWFRGTIVPLAEPQTQIIVPCTRKHVLDEYGWMLENPVWKHPDCRFKEYGHHNACGYRAIYTWPKYEYVWNEDGTYIVDVEVKGDYEILEPELPRAKAAGVLPIKWLLLQRAEQGDAYFRREYQNDPGGMEGLIFQEDWLGYWVFEEEIRHADLMFEGRRWTPRPREVDMVRLLAIDPAITPGAENDFFASVEMGVDSQARTFVTGIYEAQLTFPEQVDYIRQKGRGLTAIVVDAQAYQDALAQQVEALSGLPMKPVKTSKDKKIRAIGIQPYLEQNRVFIRPEFKDFLSQYRQFPSAAKDDIVDAFILGIEWIMGTNIGSYSWSAHRREGPGRITKGGTRGWARQIMGWSNE